MNPFVSIIVPVYNSEKSIIKCIDSIINQTYANWELLLIDDGSRDDSGRICDEYSLKDNRIKVFHKENGGVSSARNVGLNNAKGEWITFVDSDDYTYNNWIYNFIYEINKNNNIDLVMQGFKVDEPLWKDINNSQIYYRRYFGINYIGNVCDGSLLMFKNAMMGYLWNKIFKSEIIKNHKILFDNRFKFKEDEEFCLNYLKYSNKVVFIDKIGYFYNVPDSNKYNNNIDDFYLYKSLYESSLVIFLGKKNIISDFYLDLFTEMLLYSYLYVDDNKRKKLKEYRSNLGRIVLDTKLFWFTKYIIYLDCFALISDLILQLHVRLKK